MNRVLLLGEHTTPHRNSECIPAPSDAQTPGVDMKRRQFSVATINLYNLQLPGAAMNPNQRPWTTRTTERVAPPTTAW